MTVEDVEQAFGLTDLPRPWGVGVIQPKDPIPWAIFLCWPLFIFFICAAHVVAGSVLKRAPDVIMAFVAIFLVSVLPGLMIFARHQFEVSRWKDSDYSPYASDD